MFRLFRSRDDRAYSFARVLSLKSVGLVPFSALLLASAVAALANTPPELQGYGLPGGDIYVGPPQPEGGMPDSLLPGGNLPGPVPPQPLPADIAPAPALPDPQELLGPLALPQPLPADIIPPNLGIPDPSAIIDQLLNGIIPSAPGGSTPGGPTTAGLQPGDIVLTGTIAGQFAVSPTGAATYSIPVSIPPGVVGMEPKVALTYSSQNGNGVLGVGWGLSGVSAITRCAATWAQDGFAHGPNFTAGDRLCLDGQHLLAVQGIYGNGGTHYRTEVDGIARIVANGNINDTNATFTVNTKSGLTYTYGQQAAANNDASFQRTVGGQIYVWSVSRIQDTIGNYISFDYARDAATSEYTIERIEYTGTHVLSPRNSIRFFYDNSRPDPYERHLAGGSNKVTANKRLNKIETWADPATHGFPGAVKVREYRFDYEAVGAPRRSRLVALTECAFEGGAYCFPSTTFGWQTKPEMFVTGGGPALRDVLTVDSGGKKLSEIVDVNGDGLPDQVTAFQETGCGPTCGITQRTWLNQQGVDFVDGGTSWKLPSVIYIEGERTGEFADVNGDGFPDFVRSYLGSRATYINDPNSCGSTNCHWQEDATYKLPRQMFGGVARGELMDFDGDGLVDFALTFPASGGRAVYINNPAPCGGESCHWGQPSTRYALPPVQIWQSGHRLAEITDITGDGLPDVIYSVAEPEGGHCSVTTHAYINDPFHAGTTWRKDENYELDCGNYMFFADVGSHPTAQLGEFADLNGDGLKDYVWSFVGGPGSGRKAYINTGSGWQQDDRYALNVPLFTISFNNGYYTDRNGVLVDINGDGLTDHLRSINGDKRAFINGSYAGCTTAISCRWQVSTAYSNSGGHLFAGSPRKVKATLADVNGDGQLDVLTGHVEGGATSLRTDVNWCLTSISPVHCPLPDLLTSVTNGLGAQVHVSYRTLTHYGSGPYEKGAGAAYPQQDVAAPLTVVENYSYSNGIAGGLNSIHYRYEKLRAQSNGRGLLGFANVIATDSASGVADNTEYAQGYPYTGIPKSTLSMKGGQILGRSTSELDSVVTVGNAHFPYVRERLEQAFEIGSGAPFKSSRTTSTFDTYGNPTNIIVRTFPGEVEANVHQTSTVNAYDNAESNWRVGRLRRTTVTNTTPTGGSATRISSFTYDPVHGLLDSETVEPDNASLRLVTAYAYDAFGNKRQIAVGAGTASVRMTNIAYTYDGRFPEIVTNAVGHQEGKAFSATHGGRTYLAGPNGLETRWFYDAFGRLTREERPDTTKTYTAYLDCAGACVSGGVMRIYSNSTDGAISQVTLDVREREIARHSRSFNPQTVEFTRVLTQYDTRGRVAASTHPHFETASNYCWTTYEYDDLDRVKVENAPLNESVCSGRVTEYFYSGLTTTHEDPNNHSTTRTEDALGRAVTVTDALNGQNRYGYDAFGNLTSITDAKGNASTFTYDIRGRRTGQNDVSLGAWSFRYNIFGEMVGQTNANSADSSWSYDALGRVTARLQANASATWTYDTNWKGALTQVTSNTVNYNRVHTYDSVGRPRTTTITIDGRSYPTTYDYEPTAGTSRVSKVTYPDGFYVDYAYTSSGYLESARNGNTVFWQAKSQDALGNVDEESLGNGLTSCRNVDLARGHVDAITTALGSSCFSATQVQSMDYTWDAAGNLLTRSDSGRFEQFTYDALNRLKSSAATGSSAISYSYDAIGNLTNKSDVGSYTYNGERPYQVSGTSGSYTALFLYDGNGNATLAGDRTVTYTGFNLPSRIQRLNGEKSDMSYGPDREMIKQVISKIPPNQLFTVDETVNFVGDLYERRSSPAGVEHRDYIRADGKTVAMRVVLPSGATELRYLHRDHLGSVTDVTNASGTGIEELSYDSFGKRREPNWQRDADDSQMYQAAHKVLKGYTGHEMLDVVGMIHMGGRVYDPRIGKFLSADPTVQFPDSTQGWNRYSYVQNNPLAYTDPSGFSSKSVREFLSIAILFVPGLDVLALAGPELFVANLAAGFASGVIASDGDVEAGLKGAVTAAAFAGVGNSFKPGGAFADISNEFARGTLKTVLHGAVGGAAQDWSGGDFGEGFITGAFGKGATELLPTDMPPGLHLLAVITIGGTAAEIGGGKFANGARTAAFGYAFNYLSTDSTSSDGVDSTIGCELEGGCPEMGVVDGVLLAASVTPAGGFRSLMSAIMKRAWSWFARGSGAAKATTIGGKIERQLSQRGWSRSSVDDAIQNPSRRVSTRDTRHSPGGVRNDDPATAYYSREGGYVVRNDRTGDIVQISDRNNPMWKAPWD